MCKHNFPFGDTVSFIHLFCRSHSVKFAQSDAWFDFSGGQCYNKVLSFFIGGAGYAAGGQSQPMGSESLGTLVSSWRDGTFSEIWADWKWIWGYTKRYRRAVWFYTILGVASSTLGLVSAVASKYSIDIITGYDSDHLWFIVTVMVASALVGLLLRSVTSRISTKISLRVNNDIQAQVFDRLLGADWRSLNAFASGDLLSRLSTDVGSVSSSAIRWLPDLIVTAYTFAAHPGGDPAL